ncbi:MAG: hypothetical protein GXP02_03290, partial [Alphaproteobacteria bacterium]|nr:hypothetical protein [Alphaproteobacteria bacterium]
MGVNGSDWQIAYLGWSGFHLQRPAGPHIFIDPPKATIFPGNSAVIVFITHGHPEHLGGVMDLVAGDLETGNNSGHGVTIIASKTVCNYLEDRYRPDNVNFIAVSPGQQQALTAGIGFEVFQWRHMPLLPPGLWPAVRHILSMIRKFRAAARIIKMSLNGPKGPGRMLGYRVQLSSDVTIVIYGEGLHRRCSVDDVAP